MLPYFPYILFLEKNNLNKTQILQIENNFQKDFKLDPFKLPTHISYVLKKSFYLLSWKSLSCIKFQNWKYFQRNSNIFNTPCHLNKWKKSCHLLSRVLWWKEFEFMKIRKENESLGKSFYSLSLLCITMILRVRRKFLKLLRSPTVVSELGFMCRCHMHE